jgi:Flp pilus assembly pilin Flp
MIRVTKTIRRLLRREDGGALAELAILVPFLAVMLAAVCEVGRFFQNYTTLAKATRTASRYLSNHEINTTEVGRTRDLAYCGKLVCGVGDPALVNGLQTKNICIETTGSPKVTSVTVRIARESSPCNPVAGSPEGAPYVFKPIFDIGALLNNPSISMALPIAPSTTMYYMID